MKNINTKVAYPALGFILISIILIIIHVTKQDLSVFVIFAELPKALTITLILLAIFTKWIWKWSIFQNWLVLVPNLNGKWKGNIKSNWVNSETKKELDPIPTTLDIQQNLFSISIKLKTGESESYSLASNIGIIHGNKSISYTYTNIPRSGVRNRSEIHHGAALLTISDDNKQLTGEYWTSRETTGEIEVCLMNKDGE